MIFYIKYAIIILLEDVKNFREVFFILQDYLYQYTDNISALKNYIKELSASSDMHDQMHASKLESYLSGFQDKSYQREIKGFFNETFNMLSKNNPNLKFMIEGRIKPLISTERKILYYLHQNKSLDLIRDFFAVRTVLYGDTEENLIKACYKITQDIIEFAVIKGFMPCDRLPLMGVKSVEVHSNEYFSKFLYKQYIKDYICFKKENGYESLHFVLVDTKGRHLEIQIRTFKMHAFAECGDAQHQIYKSKRYKDDFDICREKIKIDGYSYINNKVVDIAGVEKGLIIFQRHKF